MKHQSNPKGLKRFLELFNLKQRTTKRVGAQLRTITGLTPAPMLAAITQRDMKNISEDVKVLLEMDLIEMEKHGKNKAPRLHYDGFRLEVAV